MCPVADIEGENTGHGIGTRFGETPKTLNLSDNKAKVGDVVTHEKSCPKCFGKGLDAFGKPCDYGRPVEPVVHTEGIKKWDDESKTWVDAMMSDRGKYLDNGIGLVNLRPGCYVTDGTPSVTFYHLEGESGP